MEEYILAHDIGTSGDKTSLFNFKGELVDSVVIPYPTYYPHRGWSEQDANDWWHAFCVGTQSVMEGRDGDCVKAIAVSGQMMGCLPVDKDGNALSRCITWSDMRAERECKYISKRVGEGYTMLTGQPVSANYSLPKLLWVKEHLPEVFEKTDCILQSKDYINMKLTGERCTDPTDACYTMVYDLHRKDWSDDILEKACIPKTMFPRIMTSETIIGTVTAKAAEECGLKEGIPVVESAGDGSAAHLGAGSVNQGDSYVCLGSSTWIVTTTEKLIFDKQMRMQSEPHVIPDKYVYAGTMQTGGMSHAWLKKNMLQSAVGYEEIDNMVMKSAPGAGGVMFMPYLMGERSPWYDANVNAAFLGLRQESEIGDMCRAVMEGVGFNLKIMLDIIRSEVPVEEIVLIGGGAKGKVWKQILADIFQVPICIPQNVEEGTSIGAAVIAGVACNAFRDFSVSREFLNVREVIEPRKEWKGMYEEAAEIFKDAYSDMKEINHRIGKLTGNIPGKA